MDPSTTSILLGIRATFKEDINATPSEMVYGESIRLPGQFLQEPKSTQQKEDSDFLRKLRTTMEQLRPTLKRHGQRATFIFKEHNAASLRET